MAERHDIALGDAEVHVAFTDRSDGDLRVDAPVEDLAVRRAAVAPLPWSWLHQVHGAAVVEVRRPGGGAGASADALVTTAADSVLAVQVADCAPVLAWSRNEVGGVVVGAAHAGWRGLEAGVLGATVEAMRRLGADSIHWVLGPCISAEHYEFGATDLDRLARSLGDGVRATTPTGAPALDMRAAVRSAMAAAGVDSEPLLVGGCTAGDLQRFSFRARADAARQAAVIWWTPS